ncbi:MAG: exo-alpha-sialidase [Candidatus Omnitrophica bacterium]|nr:exo-alpha-sialidase [Candidatus Omnitrophota bacterium]
MLGPILSLIMITQATPTADLTQVEGWRQNVVINGEGYFPVMDKMPDGRAVVVLRGGGGHLGIGGRLDLLFSHDGVLWHSKRTAVDTSADDRNPAFGVTPEGRLLLGIHHQASYNGHNVYTSPFSLARDLQVYSDDEGLTWSDFNHLELGEVGTHSPFGRIIRLQDGTYLQNVYGEHAPAVPGIPEATEGVRDYSYVVRSNDEGATWGEPALIAAGHNETTLLELKDGSVLAAARDDLNGAHLDLYRSEDKGRTWSFLVKATDKSQHPADLIDLCEGNVLLIFGNRRDEERDIRGILSRDGGQTWETEKQMRLTAPVTGDFGYPSAVVMDDDLLIVHYMAGEGADTYDGTKAKCFATLVPIEEILKTTK